MVAERRWLEPGELRLALGCMRAEPSRAADVIAEALAGGVTLFDTARAYGDSERVLGRMLRGSRARVVTKGGMVRDADGWRPDGRASALMGDCEASLEALGGVPIDTYLVHAPDPRVAWSTTVRALGRIAEQGLARHVGVCNVTRRELDEALAAAPIEVVQVDPRAAVRGGVLARCKERGVFVMIHSPLGGPKRARRLRDAREGLSPQASTLAGLLALDPGVVVVPGPTRCETLRDCLTATRVNLAKSASRVLETGAEVVLLMGIQGAGKSTLAAPYVERGYVRLNRDTRGGTLRGLHAELATALAGGARRVVLDNTYTTWGARHEAIATAQAHGARVRGVWIEAPLEDAQVRVIQRMLTAHGRLLEPAEMARASDPSALPPHALLRTMRELERPTVAEGFASLEVVPLAPARRTGSRTARFVAHDAAPQAGDVTFAWGARATLACMHGGGPPVCWCRPPYPGLLLAYAAAHDIDLRQSEVVGTSPAHAKMAASVGATYRPHR